MIRATAVVSFIIGLFAAAIFGPRWVDSLTADDEQGARCDLLADRCRWQVGHDQRWEASLQVAGEAAEGVVYQLRVETTATPGRILGILTGESMYMGEYPVLLTRKEVADHPGSVWAAEFAAPFCTESSAMTWQLELQPERQPFDEHPLTLVFQEAESR